MSARRFASVRMRGQTLCPPLPAPGRAVLNQSRSAPNRRRRSRLVERAVDGIEVKLLADTGPIEATGRAHVKDRRTFGHRSEQMMERRHAAVVQVRIVRPDASQWRGGVSLAPDETAFRSQRALVERGDELVRDDIEAAGIGADVLVDARPLDVAGTIV